MTPRRPTWKDAALRPHRMGPSEQAVRALERKPERGTVHDVGRVVRALAPAIQTYNLATLWLPG